MWFLQLLLESSLMVLALCFMSPLHKISGQPEVRYCFPQRQYGELFYPICSYTNLFNGFTLYLSFFWRLLLLLQICFRINICTHTLCWNISITTNIQMVII